MASKTVSVLMNRCSDKPGYHYIYYLAVRGGGSFLGYSEGQLLAKLDTWQAYTRKAFKDLQSKLSTD